MTRVQSLSQDEHLSDTYDVRRTCTLLRHFRVHACALSGSPTHLGMQHSYWQTNYFGYPIVSKKRKMHPLLITFTTLHPIILHARLPPKCLSPPSSCLGDSIFFLASTTELPNRRDQYIPVSAAGSRWNPRILPPHIEVRLTFLAHFLL